VIAFYIFLAAGLFAAIYSPIQDCDEVFNYWEPSHYLNHGYGLQTWEYSPVYAIRSWTYAGIHSIIISLKTLVPFGRTKTFEFYFVRCIFAAVCAACQTRLFSVVLRSMNPRIAIMFLIISVTSPGMFISSTAYLPSTFAMYTTMLGTAAFMNWRGGLRTAQGIMWFGIGATLGWPFAAALVAPFIIEEALIASWMGDAVGMLSRILDGTVRSLIVLVCGTMLFCILTADFVCRLYRRPLMSSSIEN
jgi:alpha-1,2-mannosyltransferase